MPALPMLCQRVACWGTLAEVSSCCVRRGLAGKDRLFSVPQALSQEERWKHPPGAQTAAPCSWAGRVGSCGILHLQQTSRMDGCWGGRRGSPPGTHCPFHGAGRSQVTAGRHRGAGQAWAQSLLCPGSSQPTRAHMHKHTALRKPKIYSQQPPTRLHTRASTHLCSPGRSHRYLLPDREAHNCGTLPALLLVPHTP